MTKLWLLHLCNDYQVILLASDCTFSLIASEIINPAKKNSELAMKQTLLCKFPWYQAEGLINYALPYLFFLSKAKSQRQLTDGRGVLRQLPLQLEEVTGTMPGSSKRRMDKKGKSTSLSP